MNCTRCGINTGSRNPSVYGYGAIWSHKSLWLWGSIPLPCSSLILKVPQHPSGFRKKDPSFLCFVWGDAHQVAFHHPLYLWPGFSVQGLLVAKGWGQSWAPSCPQVYGWSHVFLYTRVCHLLGCPSVQGAACVGRGWDRLCCWYPGQNFAASTVLPESSAPSIVWG